MPEPRNRNIFLVIYGILFSVGVGLIVYRGPDDAVTGWVDQVIWIWGATAPLAAVSVPGAVVLTEITRWIMVLAAWLENRLERSREEYRAKLRAETDREWEGWNERREAAATRGEPFSEPPPSVSRNGRG